MNDKEIDAKQLSDEQKAIFQDKRDVQMDYHRNEDTVNDENYLTSLIKRIKHLFTRQTNQTNISGKIRTPKNRHMYSSS
jgi:predicted double-glycine peptidase